VPSYSEHIVAGAETIRITANHINFEVLTMGSGDRLALCLHGFPEHAFSWRFQMPLLAKLGYRVWAPNLRGYGATDSPPGVQSYQTETLVADVAGLIEAAGVRETLLIAHDWGGLLAWIVAMRHPRLIDRLVILNVPHPACFIRECRRPAQLLRSWYMLLFQIPGLPEFLMGLRHGRFIARAIRLTSSASRRFPNEVTEVYRQNAARKGGLAAMVNWYRALLRGGGLKRCRDGGFPKIQAPTLLLWGGADSFFTAQATVGHEDFVSDLTYRLLPGVSHWVQQEAPEAVNAMLEAWLSGARVPEYAEVASASGLEPR
jgi:pimeloyl-ACP methyl ester carboxylesterase